uniref:SPIN-DOC-like zinc-finger domain-containing protein n=1 Tax=Felis catus TaxID=9685 RepID=A0ABI8AHS3_FELCA
MPRHTGCVSYGQCLAGCRGREKERLWGGVFFPSPPPAAPPSLGSREYFRPRALLLIALSGTSPPAVAQQEKTPPPRPNLLEAGGDGCEEPRQQVSWEQEFLVGNSPGGSGRALCMVCGAEIRSPSADTARMHILEQHPHTLDLSPSEKSNILEAWSEGVALLQDVRAEQPSSPTSDLGQDVEADPDSDPDPAKMPAEIVVLLDSEDNPSLPKRSRPRGLRPLEFPAAPASEPGNKKPRGQRWKEPPGEEPVRKKRGRPMTKNLDLDPDPDPDPPSPDSPTETFAAPAEVRHFTDGSFPPGFVLQLFSHTQLRASDSKDSPKEGRAAEGGLPQPESPSPGELLRGDHKGGSDRHVPGVWPRQGCSAAESREEVVSTQVS